MRKTLFSVAIVAVVLSYASTAEASLVVSPNTTLFALTGAGINASGTISYMLDTIPGDPVGAYNITSVTGTFSDANVGVSNAKITGLIATSPNPANAPFATSLSYLPVLDLPPPDGGALSYSNLFYPLGAPDTCFDGITGGYFDVFGMMLTLDNGDVVGVWSDGGGPDDSPIYGVAVASDGAYTAIDYIGGGVTMNLPEPGSLLLLSAGLALTGLARRKRRSSAA